MEVTKANLATYLAGLTPSVTPYPIEITETVGTDWRNSGTSGTVGSIIRASTPSGVYLDLGLTIIPNSVTNMSYTFHVCTSLTTAPVIPNSVTSMAFTFRDCTSLTTVPVIPSSVINMNGTFRDCTSLTTVPVIPSSVINIGYTFYGCIKLHTIQNFSVDVDNCDMTNAFQNCPALANIYVTTPSESTWHLLHTNTGATGTDYTIYNPDGTVAGSGTVAGTSQVLTLYGKSDELVISANITPTLAVETATSQVQWHKSGLPYDDELMIFNAKNPDTVISNFITVNRAGEEFLGNASTATLATQALAIKPLGNSITLQATPTSVTKIIKIATIDVSYAGTVNFRSSGAYIADVVKVVINGHSSLASGVRVVYGKNNTTYGIKKIVVTSDTPIWNSNRQIYAEIVTYDNNPSTTVLGVVETNYGTLTPSMTDVSSIEGTVRDSLELNYLRGDISSYQHEFTKNIIGNVTGDVTGNATLTNLDVNAKASFGSAGEINSTNSMLNAIPPNSAYFPNIINKISALTITSGTITGKFYDGIEIGNRWILVGADSASKGIVAYSDNNGASWTTINLNIVRALDKIIDSNGRLVTVGGSLDAYGNALIAYSDNNGITWTTVDIPIISGSRYWGLVSINNRLVAIGDSSWAYSDDRGSTWTHFSKTWVMFDIIEIDGRLVGVGDKNGSTGNGFYCDNPNASTPTWNTLNLPSGIYRSITKLESRLIAIGHNVCAYSDDRGTTWTPVTIGGIYYKIITTGRRLIAIGNNVCAYSDDRGITWTPVTIEGIYRGAFMSTIKKLIIVGENKFGHINNAWTGLISDSATTATTAQTAITASNGFINIKQSASFTLGTYDDGTHVSVANTHATNTITCTLPTGQTMNGQSSFTIAPDTLLEFRLIDTKWKCVSNEWEHIITYTGTGAKSTGIGQYRTLRLELYNSAGDLILTSIPTIAPRITMGFMLGAESGSHYIGGVTIACNTSTKTITSFELYYWQRFSFGSLKIYGMK